MIYDCFPFNNELDLLEIRLNMLDSFVDKFVLVESRATFTNIDKPLYYDLNKERYGKFRDKIIHIKIDAFPVSDPWECNYYQVNQIMKGLGASGGGCRDDDIIMISDVDEIPNVDYLYQCFSMLDKDESLIFGCYNLLFQFYLNYLLYLNPIWKDGTKIFKFKKFYNTKLNETGTAFTPIQPIEMRYLHRNLTAQELSGVKYVTIRDGGWHFSYTGGAEAVIAKTRASAHTDCITKYDYEGYYTDPEKVEKYMKLGISLFGGGLENCTCCSVSDSRFLPQFILEHWDTYRHMLCEYHPIDEIPWFNRPFWLRAGHVTGRISKC